MDPIKFWAQGIPKGQPRPRAFARGGHAAVYDPATAEGWKGQIALAAKAFLPSEPIAGPILLHLEFYMERPKSHYKKSGEIKDSSPGYHTGKPDADNLAKAVMDALTTLRMWEDDAQICHLIVRKLYDDGRGSGCLSRIESL